jgi:nucleoside phosphorylase
MLSHGAAALGLGALILRIRHPRPALRTVVILCAVEEEALHVRAGLDSGSVREGVVRGTPLRLTTGTCGGGAVRVELVVTHIGAANAASATTAVLLERALRGAAPPDALISCGCAGAHREDLLVGDVVVGTEVVPVGQAKVLADGTVVPKGFRRTCQTPMVATLRAAPSLLSAARAVAAAATADGSNRVGQRVGDGRLNGSSVGALFFGPVASSDAWVCAVRRLRELHGAFGTLCEEMEAAAVANVAAAAGVPFLAVKDISNNELHQAAAAAAAASTTATCDLAPPPAAAAAVGVAPSELDLPSIGRAAAEVTLAVLRIWSAQTV